MQTKMTSFAPWLLPEGVEEVLPDQAWHLEHLRRRLLDLLDARGYDLVMPPLVEYLESLLTGVGEDLDLQTVKVTDQATGRLMGVRADHTPQVARIDAHLWRREGPTRLCYIGSVLHARPGALGGSRQPIQVGAELFGCSHVAADCEIIETMLAVLSAAGVADLHLGLGHVGIYRSLVDWAGLNGAMEQRLFDALRRKSKPDVQALLQGYAPRHREVFALLPEMNGDPAILGAARRRLASTSAGAERALEEIAQAVEFVRAALPSVKVSVDLAELRGYRYHTGLVFSAYTQGHGAALAQGGRYDGIGGSFGRGRSATGFSADLRAMIARGTHTNEPPRRGIAAPAGDSPSLRELIAALRAAGERVLVGLPGQDTEQLQENCDRRIEGHDGNWQVTAFESEDNG